METFWITVPTLWITPEIVKRLGRAIWLLLLLLSRTTSSVRGLGLVYGGSELRDERLFAELGISHNTLGRYRGTLEKSGFVHTKTEWMGLKRWFVIGCHKYEDRKVTKWQADLAEGAWKKIIAAVPKDPSQILNPLYFELVQEMGGDIQRPIKDGEPEPISEGIDISSDATATKNGVSINDTIKDKIADKANEEEGGGLRPTAKACP